jgi:hypothetical protein
VKNEIKAQYKINANGWNSKYDTYEMNNNRDKYRIAVIGDSFVQALEVDYDKSIAERLEEKLGSEYSQVYRFGIGGAPMSQYLHMLRNEVIKYKPALVVILMIHNDFDESYQFTPGVYTSSFLKIEIENNKITREIQPDPYSPPWYNFFRETATWRYLSFRQQVRFQFLRDIILGGSFIKDASANREGSERDKYQANIDISMLGEERISNEILTDYVFGQLKTSCRENNADILILMDGDRDSIYRNLNDSHLYRKGALSLNVIAQSMAQKHNIHFIDLHPMFAEEFSLHHKSFTFPHDGHWNAYAHDIVADLVSGYIRDHFDYTHPTAREGRTGIIK